MDKQLIQNGIRTPDGTELFSFFRHDYRAHLDKVTGNCYMVDGGLDYIRRSCFGDEEDISQYLEPDNHIHNREYFHWGTRGIKGGQPIKRVKLKDMNTDHINAILDTQHHIPPWIRSLFIAEREYRNG